MEDEEAGVNIETVMQEENDYFCQEDQQEELTKTFDDWQRAHSKIFINKDIFPSYHAQGPFRRYFFFIKFTTFFPSSAAMEKMLSSAGNIVRAKRFSLKASKFK